MKPPKQQLLERLESARRGQCIPRSELIEMYRSIYSTCGYVPPRRRSGVSKSLGSKGTEQLGRHLKDLERARAIRRDETNIWIIRPTTLKVLLHGTNWRNDWDPNGP